MIKCPNCENVLSSVASECDKCGFKFSRSRSHKSGGSFNFAKLLKIVIPVVALALVAVIVISVISKPINCVVYVRDSELFISDSKDSVNQISQNYIKDISADNSNLINQVRISDDNKKLFYAIDYKGSQFSLYYKNVTQMDKQSVKLSSDVNSYDISDDGTIVTYIKDAKDLFQHNLSAQSDKIDTNVVNFFASDDGKKIIYVKEADHTGVYDIYLYQSGKKTKKIASEIDFINMVSDDLSTIYYSSLNRLFMLEVGKTPKKLLEDVVDVVKIYDSGEIYFARTNDEDGSMTLNYFNGKKTTTTVIDNYSGNDKIAESKPIIISTNYVENNLAYNLILKDKTYPIEHNVFSIEISSNGNEVILLADFDISTRLCDLYTAKIDDGLKKVNQITSGVIKGNYISGNDYIYFKDFDSNKQTATLYYNNIEVDENVFVNKYCHNKENDNIFYFTDVDDEKGTLNVYSNKKSSIVMEDVLISSLNTYDDTTVMFFSDFKNDEGILYSYSNNMQKIDHDVSSIVKIISNEEYDNKIRAQL